MEPEIASMSATIPYQDSSHDLDAPEWEMSSSIVDRTSARPGQTGVGVAADRSPHSTCAREYWQPGAPLVSSPIAEAIRNAQQREGLQQWAMMKSCEQTSAIYQELCRIDTGCQRTGSPADAALPPCPASTAFRIRRRCNIG
jgi:hypothetical protein